jgi:hypothetical protein
MTTEGDSLGRMMMRAREGVRADFVARDPPEPSPSSARPNPPPSDLRQQLFDQGELDVYVREYEAFQEHRAREGLAVQEEREDEGLPPMDLDEFRREGERTFARVMGMLESRERYLLAREGSRGLGRNGREGQGEGGLETDEGEPVDEGAAVGWDQGRAGQDR